MSASCDKLPSRLEWKMFRGDAERYKNALYGIFQRDFLSGILQFQGKNVDIIHEKFFEGKERSFWHIISEGNEDTDRELNTERCASLPWAKPLIEDDGKCEYYRIWTKWHDKTNRNRYYIWCTAVDYMVILEDRDTHFKLITAYNVLPYKVKSYEKDYKKYGQTKTPI